MHHNASGRTGLWLVGARGSVATTATLGLAAIVDGRAAPTGCVTAQEPFASAPLPAFADLVVGGHDITDVSMAKHAELLVEAGMIPPRLLASTHAALERADAEVRRGYDARPGVLAQGPRESQQAAAERLAADITDFRERNGLARVVVVDLASTEPLPEPAPEFSDRALLEAALADPDRAVLPPSSVVAYAALLAGAPYAGFTPSASMDLPVLVEIARERGVPVAGQDGKTGQTWLRTILAPAFAARGLRVLSWAGANLLGGGDGATLADPEAVRSKLASKTRGLQDLTGSEVTPLHIDNVPDLGDIKVAWDHVHVEGFLGSRLTLQTTWSAYDSMLAAPLVLDLARLLALADAAGCAGPVPELGFFFKDPWGSDVHDFATQTVALADWVRDAGARVVGRAGMHGSTGDVVAPDDRA
ncbi:inositol-3-phosphate synthase [Cellulosimicrobium sp. Marseille-Q4280]|jgi:myo-inositol-1-phosphate synthase|uniref:inositol-3-phosphate synthase n=1 Tax=Cellulosimicrobium sp. Marseille-Q4280 TaxID=2937992 RepID=UPI00203DC7BD|nr:inositol-3-phosphate synthase [Cellulosimicrobium sp. Marseille-Q4280]